MHSRWQLGSNWGSNLDPSKMLFTSMHLGETKWQLRYFQGWTNNAFKVATWLRLKANKKRFSWSGNFGSSNSHPKSYRPIAIEIFWRYTQSEIFLRYFQGIIEIFSRYTQSSPHVMCKWQKRWEKVHHSFPSDQHFICELLNIWKYMIINIAKGTTDPRVEFIFPK